MEITKLSDDLIDISRVQRRRLMGEPSADDPYLQISPQQELFDIADAVKYFQEIGAKSATVNFVRELINSGQIAHVRIGKKFYVTRAALDGWVQKHEKRTR